MLEKEPNGEELAALVGQSLYDVWSKLCALIDDKYGMEGLWNKGGKAWKYEYKYRWGGKTLCALYARENGIGFMIIFGKDERAKFEAARNNFSKQIQKIYDEAKVYHDGKWIMFEPADTSMFDDFINLLAIKRKPSRKSALPASVPRIILVGAGDRGMIYARQSLEKPRRFQIVGIVEPIERRRNFAGDLFDVSNEFRFSSVEEAASVPKFADAVFNCTMDKFHADTSLPLMEKGYHMLLEKPIAANRTDAERILRSAKKNQRIVMVCHVLRYAPFYKTIKQMVLDKEIGDIIDIQMAERVSYFHESVSYVRGKYGDPDICGSGMLLSKCSHDLDIMAWFMGGTKPDKVFSAGSLFQFKPENAPAGARERCLPDCPHLDSCVYSCKRLYVDYPQRWANRVWNDSNLTNGTREEKITSLSNPNNQYGRCVYQTQMKVVDHQSVLVLFQNGSTGTMSMTAGASAAERSIHITGTLGEIYGEFSKEQITVSLIAPQEKDGRITRMIDVSAAQKGDAHGNGDRLIVQDFLALLAGDAPSVCCTAIEDSMTGHEIVFAAEKSASFCG